MYTLKFASWFDGRIRQFFLRKKKTQLNIRLTFQIVVTHLYRWVEKDV